MAGRGQRVLVVEDEGLVALSVCEDLRSLDYEPLEPVGSVEDGLKAVRSAGFDLALVDLNLKGVMSFPLVDELISARTPFALMTAYSGGDIPDRFAKVPRLEKPFEIGGLRRMLAGLRDRELSGP